MSIEISYCGVDGQHLTIHHDGTIEFWFKEIHHKGEDTSIRLSYSQSSLLKKMIIAENELQKG